MAEPAKVTQIQKVELGLTKKEETAIARLDEVAGAIQTLEDGGPFAQAFQRAAAMQALREALTTELVESRIMPLYGSAVGFLADRPNEKIKSKYDVDTVRTCCIEAVMRGARVVGNEFNILASRCYLTKAFFERALAEWPGLTDLVLQPGVPQAKGEKGAIVQYRASWKLDGVEDSIEREIPIRVNAFMGADAILGKAKRKILAAVYERLAGSVASLPEGEVGDAEAIPVESRTVSSAEIDPDDLQAEAVVLLDEAACARIEKAAKAAKMTDEQIESILHHYTGETDLSKVPAAKEQDLLKAISRKR